jgi:hypothetical protein
MQQTDPEADYLETCHGELVAARIGWISLTSEPDSAGCLTNLRIGGADGDGGTLTIPQVLRLIHALTAALPPEERPTDLCACDHFDCCPDVLGE